MAVEVYQVGGVQVYGLGQLAKKPGGTTGQVEVKRSDVDYDTEWQDAAGLSEEAIADLIEQQTTQFFTEAQLLNRLNSYASAESVAYLGQQFAAKADLVGGKIPTAQIPALATSEVVAVASQAAMVALTTTQVQRGDFALRTDTTPATMFVLTADDPSVLGNWTRISSPTSGVTTVNGQAGTVVLGKADVGLGSVDNTADTAKPVSTAQQNALDLKANRASPTFTGTVSGITKSMVGLSNVDNTSDVNKPVSTAQANAIAALKVPMYAYRGGDGTASQAWVRPTTRKDVVVIFRGLAPQPDKVADGQTNGAYYGDSFEPTDVAFPAPTA